MSTTDPAQGTPQRQSEPAEGQAAPDPGTLISVTRGNPTPAQLAALTVALAALSGDGRVEPARRGTLWNARSRYARPRPAVGPDGWRSSALPR